MTWRLLAKEKEAYMVLSDSGKEGGRLFCGGDTALRDSPNPSKKVGGRVGGNWQKETGTKRGLSKGFWGEQAGTGWGPRERRGKLGGCESRRGGGSEWGSRCSRKTRSGFLAKAIARPKVEASFRRCKMPQIGRKGRKESRWILRQGGVELFARGKPVRKKVGGKKKGGGLQPKKRRNGSPTSREEKVNGKKVGNGGNGTIWNYGRIRGKYM